jgi:hypothetical protein
MTDCEQLRAIALVARGSSGLRDSGACHVALGTTLRLAVLICSGESQIRHNAAVYAKK